VQSLIPQLPLLEKLLDGLIGSCGMEKSFLFDVVSKIYVATDSNPVDMQTYELCSDMIDVVIDVSCIYGLKPQEQLLAEAEAGNDQEAYDADSASVIKLSNNYILYLREVNKSVQDWAGSGEGRSCAMLAKRTDAFQGAEAMATARQHNGGLIDPVTLPV